MSYQDHRPPTEAAATAIAERRGMHDRRVHTWRTLTYCGFQRRGRRRHARRNGHSYYLDWYEPKLVFTGIAVLAMSFLDAVFTLALLDRGAYEANYFMARLIETSDELFFAVKLAVTTFGIIILLIYSHFQICRTFKAKRLLELAVTVYGLLIGYELILLAVT